MTSPLSQAAGAAAPHPADGRALSPCASPAHNAGLDVLRIVSMLFIVAGHYAMHGVGQAALAAMPPSATRTVLHLLLLLGIPGVDCFVLITGYFLVKTRWRAQKTVRLAGQVYFYLLAIFALAKLTGFAPISEKNSLYYRVFWFTSSAYLAWFAAAYLLLYLFVPFLNACLLHLSQRQHAALVLLCCAVWSLLPTFLQEEYLYTSSKLTLFFMLYCIGAYIRLYPCRLFEKCGLNFALAGIFLAWNVFRVVLFDARGAAGEAAFEYVVRIKDAAQLPVLAFAVFFFLGCKNLRVPSARWLRAASAATFGVYLIHDDAILSPVLWAALGAPRAAALGPLAVALHAAACAVGIFLVCGFLDVLRARLVEAPLLAFFEKHGPALRAAARRAAAPALRALRGFWRLLNR